MMKSKPPIIYKENGFCPELIDIEIVSIPIAIVDNKGDILCCNSHFSNLTEYSKKELPKKNFNDLLVKKDINEILSKVKKGGRLEEKVDIKRKLNYDIPQSIFCKAIGTENEMFSITVVDRSYLKSLEEENSKLTTRLDTVSCLSLFIAHDSGGPIFKIISLATYLKGNIKNFNKEINSIIQAAEHLSLNRSKLLNALKSSDIEMEEPEIIEFDKLIDDVFAQHQHFAHLKNIELKRDQEMPTFRCNRFQMSLVFNNLIENAVKYADDKKEYKFVKVKYENKSEHIFKIEDNGVGIPINEIDYIFDERFRSKRDEISTRFGFGYGLPTCRRIITDHNGSISVDSKLGNYTIFEIHLPVNGGSE